MWCFSFDVCWYTRGNGAGSTSLTQPSSGCWVGGVKPEHVGVVVVSEGHDKDHSTFESSSHVSQASLVFECIVVAKGSFLCVAELSSNGVASDVWNQGLGVGDGLAALDVESLDFSEWITDELSDDGELLGSIYG